MAKMQFDGYQELLYAKDTFFVFDDFNHYVTTDTWTSVLTDAGATTVGDARGGILTVDPSDGTVADNDEAYVKTTAELFLVSANRPLYCAAYMQYTEINTDDANVFVGFANAIAADILVDAGAGMRTTGNYFVFFKVDGGTTWQVRSRNGTETETNDTGITAGGSAYNLFEIFVNDEGNGTSVRATFKINGIECRDATSMKPIAHTILVASSTEMNFGFGVKNGDTNQETLLVDWAYAAQKR